MAQFYEMNDEFCYEYDGVYGSILSEYATPERIDVYLDDEVFDEVIKSRYKSIDLSGDNEKDLDRFRARKEKTAEWLRKQVALFHNKQ